MPVTVTSKSAAYQIPAFFPEKPTLRLADIHASSKTSSVPTEKPVTASYFYIAASGTEDPPFPAYTYDEVSIVLEGALVLKDETGTSYVLKKGDTFLVTKGSVVSFNTEDYALCWKVGGRWMGEY